MLELLYLKNVGPAPELRFEAAQRLNLITGDNGLGKSFLLDVAWWALTRTWAGTIALPTTPKGGTIEYVVHGKGGAAEPVVSKFRREDESWPLNAKRPPMPGIIVYIRIDGGFSVWDPARNYWRSDPDRAAAYHFTASEVWDGLTIGERRASEGLERDWVNWQEGRKPQFEALEQVLRVMSPVGETLRAGPPRRLFLGEGRDRPTLLVGSQEVPVALASAGVRRALALAYFLVWAWHEHRVAAKLLDREPEDRFVILFDEPETHLHPRWQRTIAPSLIAAIDALRGDQGTPPQVLIATHAPLVLASIEPMFSPELDELFHLKVVNGKVVLCAEDLALLVWQRGEGMLELGDELVLARQLMGRGRRALRLRDEFGRRGAAPRFGPSVMPREVRRDPEDPGLDARAPREPSRAALDLQERLLDQIVGAVRIGASEPREQALDRGAMAIEHRAQRRRLAHSTRSEQRHIGHLRRHAGRSTQGEQLPPHRAP